MKGLARRVFAGRMARRFVQPVASDRMLILLLDLPPMAAAQRKAAAQFMVEPHLAQPMEEVQVILGPRLEGDRGAYLAVVVARNALGEVMAQHPKGRADLVPDVLLLPRPAGDSWTAAEREGCLLARLPDGTGFSATEAGFRAVWQLAGQPGLHWVQGKAPPDLILSSSNEVGLDWQPEATLVGFNLAGDRLPDWRHPRKLMALAAALILGLAAHLGILALETQRVAKAADAAELRLRQVLAERGVVVGTSVDAAASAALKGAKTGDGKAFLPLLSAAFDAMQDQSGVVALQDLTFDRLGGKLTLTLLASDLGPLQDTQALLTKAGLDATLGALTNRQGQARATVAILPGSAG